MVTATLERLLTNAIQPLFSAFDVTTDRPRRNGEDADGITGTGAAVNIFLYQANPNPAWRNHDLPTRTSGGQVTQRPTAALDLHYLFTFYGDESLLEPQRLLGITVATLHATPVISRELIRATKIALGGGDLALLAASDLDEQIDQVRIAPHCFDLDHMSKLWSIFSQNAYALSVAYQASVVLIEAEQTPAAALPVRVGSVYTVTYKQPQIDAARSESGGLLTVGSRAVLTGSNLQADIVRVRLGAVEIEPLAVADSQIVFAVPLTARAGVQAVQVTHPLLLGEPPTLRPGADSNAAAMVVSPQIVSTAQTGTTLNVRVQPAVGSRQRAQLLLVQLDPPLTVQLDADAPTANPDLARDVLPFDVSGVQAGTYLVRVQVDGAQSPLGSAPDGTFISPTVTL
jgi:hypothetical protein